MLKDFILPDLVEGVVSCEVLAWKIHEGDYVHEDQVVADVATDKAIVEIPAMFSGKVDHLCYREGEVAKVGTPLFTLQVAANEQLSEHDEPAGSTSSDHNQQQTVQKAVENKAVMSAASQPQETVVTPSQVADRVLATPAVRKLAREQRIDLADVTGSGKDGRILKDDIVQFLESNQKPDRPNTVKSDTSASDDTAKTTLKTGNSEELSNAIRGASATQRTSVLHTADNELTLVGMTAVQREMATKMTQAHAEVPQFSLMEEVCMDALLLAHKRLRKALPKQAADGQLTRKQLSLTPWFIKTLAVMLRRFPLLNSRIDMAQKGYYLMPHINVGIAIDTPRGLVVPVLKGVESMSLYDVALAHAQLVTNARNGVLPPDAYHGGTITLSNIGALGGLGGTPMVKPPEVAIAAIGQVREGFKADSHSQPVVSNHVYITWSADHRLIDGATMTKAMNAWKALLEHPEQALLHW